MKTQKITVEHVQIDIPMSDEVEILNFKGMSLNYHAIVINHYPNISVTSIQIMNERVYQLCEAQIKTEDSIYKIIFHI